MSDNGVGRVYVRDVRRLRLYAPSAKNELARKMCEQSYRWLGEIAKKNMEGNDAKVHDGTR